MGSFFKILKVYHGQKLFRTTILDYLAKFDIRSAKLQVDQD